MTELGFLPKLPPAANALALFGMLLLAGVVGGELARRLLSTPRVVGYVLMGLALGGGGLNLLDAQLVKEAWIFVEIALGLILYALGRRVDLAWLRRDPWLGATSVLESALSFALIFLALLLFDVRPLYAAVAASIGIATSPAVVMTVVHELRAEGQVTERTMSLVAMNNVIAFVVATMLLAGIHHEYRAGWAIVVLHPLYLLAGSTLLGYLANLAAMVLARWLGRSERGHFVMTLALIALTIGAARMLELSVVLALLTFGMFSRNLDQRHDLKPFDMGPVGETFVVVLFVVSGATLGVGELMAGGGLALVFVLARFAGKSVSVMGLTYFSGLRPGAAGSICLALTPMSGLAISMLEGATRLYPEFGERLSAIVLSAVLILELAGPIAVQFALTRAGEARAEEP